MHECAHPNFTGLVHLPLDIVSLHSIAYLLNDLNLNLRLGTFFAECTRSDQFDACSFSQVFNLSLYIFRKYHGCSPFTYNTLYRMNYRLPGVTNIVVHIVKQWSNHDIASNLSTFFINLLQNKRDIVSHNPSI